MEKIKKALQRIPFHIHSWIATAVVLMGFLFMWIGKESGEGYLWVFIAGLILVILALIYCLVVFRCPHCGSLLGTRTIPEYCPHCGKKMEK